MANLRCDHSLCWICHPEIAVKTSATPDSEKIKDLRAVLVAIIDAVDYTNGACRLTEPIGAVLPKPLLEHAHRVLKYTV